MSECYVTMIDEKQTLVLQRLVVLSNGSISIQWIEQLVSLVLIHCIVIYHSVEQRYPALEQPGQDLYTALAQLGKKNSITLK